MEVAGLAATAHDLGYPRLLVDKLEDVRRVDEDSNGAADGDREEDKQLKSVDHHRDVSPVFYYL